MDDSSVRQGLFAEQIEKLWMQRLRYSFGAADDFEQTYSSGDKGKLGINTVCMAMWRDFHQALPMKCSLKAETQYGTTLPWIDNGKPQPEHMKRSFW